MAFERMRGRAVALLKERVQTAIAVREVVALDEMETMWAEPEGARCVSLGWVSDRERIGGDSSDFDVTDTILARAGGVRYGLGWVLDNGCIYGRAGVDLVE